MFEKFKRNHTRANAIVKIGNSLNYLSVQVKNVARIIENSNYNDEEVNQTILFLFYYSNVEIIEKMEEFECSFTHKLIVPDIGGHLNWITIGYALTETSLKINFLIAKMGLQKEAQQILDKGPMYFEMEEFYQEILKAAEK